MKEKIIAFVKLSAASILMTCVAAFFIGVVARIVAESFLSGFNLLWLFGN